MGVFLRLGPGEGLTLLGDLAQLEVLVGHWRSFFRQHDIGVNMNSGTWDAAAVARTIAAEAEDGLDVAYQWSESFNFIAPSEPLGTRHLVFLRGGMHQQLFAQSSYQPDLSLVGGYLLDYEALRDDSLALQKGLLAKLPEGAFVLGVFDSSVLERQCHSIHDLARFYQSLFQWALDRPDTALLLKPKDAQNLNRLGDAVKGMKRRLGDAGRLVVADSSIKPLAVAAACDFIVGFGLNSAVLESAYQGRRGVHLDLTDLRHNYLYDYEGRLVFQDCEAFVAALDRYREDPAQEPGLGDHTVVIDALEPFRDGHAYQRLCHVLVSCLRALDAGRGWRGALEDVAGLYGDTHGEGFVFRGALLGQEENNGGEGGI